jgi:hypothetical protein
MALSTPEWLAKHGGATQLTADGVGCMVFFDGQPQYFVLPRPAAGRFASQVTQTINGKRLESGATYPTADQAVLGGLEDLRNVLGW